jgi:elongation factor P--(R)-beta-lysine ligase
LLMVRNAAAAKVREYFAARDFVEADTAAIQISPGNETHIHALGLDLHRSNGETARRYLHTSPEFAMKKLLAAGETRIFNLAHVFRDREHGPLHACEFTMLEWYRTGDTFEDIIDDCAGIVRLAAQAAGVPILRYRQQTADPFEPVQRLSVAEAFMEYAAIDLLASCREDGSTDRAVLAEAALHKGIAVRDADSWSDIFSRLLVSMIEPNLGRESLCILHSYPRSEAALSAANRQDPRIADRFELYACGVELANGFRELTDAAEQRRRFEAQMAQKERIYGERYPLDENFLQALTAMPPASGVALGFDRLIMLATGAPDIHRVMWTPAEV